MKKGIHPKYNQQTQVTCSCGNVFTVGSVQDTLTVDICNKCHPFFTGEMKFVDRQGRVDKFMKKMQKAEAIKGQNSDKKAKAVESKEDTQSYKDILRGQQTAMKQAEKAAKTKTKEAEKEA
jgi:large subunit ribosomal protein L31